MQKPNQRFLLATCAAVAGTLCAVSGADATPSIFIYGGGSSLIAPYWNQLYNCYGSHSEVLYNQGAGVAATDSPEPAYFNYVGNGGSGKPQNCATKVFSPKSAVSYMSTGSGTGIEGMYAHAPSLWSNTPTDGTWTNSTAGQPFPTVNYAYSDAGLSTGSGSDIACYDNTSGSICTEHGAQIASGSSVACGTTGSSGGHPVYPNPLYCYGPEVQFPISVDPVAIAYSPTYEMIYNSSGPDTAYHFNFKYGSLRLDVATYCGIFTGAITNWNQIPKSLNGGESYEDPSDPTSAGSWSVPLQIVGRWDSSGTTSIFYRHTAAVCGASPTTDYSASGGTTLPTAMGGGNFPTPGNAGNYSSGPTYPGPSGETLGKFTIANGSTGVATYLQFPSSEIGSGSGGTYTKIILGRVG